MSEPRRRPLTARGAGALVLGVLFAIAANVVSAPILIYVAVLLFAVTALAVVVVHMPRRSGTVTRQISTDLLTVGEESRITVRFALRSLRIPHGRWRDVLPDAVTGDAAGEYPPDTGVLRYPITGVRRGIWPVGPLILRTVDPFGLAQREQAFGETRTVTVVPEVIPLAPLAAHWGAAGGTAHTASSRLGQGSDNLSPRHYVSGDSMRRIHWRATAHRGELMVRQEEEESNPDAVVVIDRAAGRWARADRGVDAAFEAAVSACASISLHLAGEGYSVDVVDSTGASIGTLRGHEDERDELLVALAMITPRGEGRDLATIVGGTPPGPLVLITGRIPADDRAALHHGGAAVPILLATAPAPDLLAAASAAGWTGAVLTDDISGSWEQALPERMITGGGRVPR
ncbi:DUF58 domain-containing protein [Microbacterium sp. M28]|uniref:DUF58 domain-containing protein n=1 Tax=Microbacterium sp. M28 TaxID=2962064 RepID=UPI0021F4A80B|nr:DUF58 domain-containing protein [Microbacterium sp. M28]UYO97856.1 DUF58 domain-containing protein [Microbacterium sp. M28]